MDDLIYIVEDDEGIRELYDGAFEGIFATKMFENGKDFFREFRESRPSLIILDIMLPGMDGLELLKHLRSFSDIPVILASAKGTEYDRITGLDAGADDYCSTLCSPLEILARIKGQLRR